MHKLYTYGCSNTYGEGLQDCWDPHAQGINGSPPSSLAWPNLVAQELNLECHNLSFPGISNKMILHRFLNTHIDNNTTVVIAWTYPTRWCMLTSNLAANYAQDPHSTPDLNRDIYNSFGPWKRNSRNKNYYKNLYDARDASHELWQYMHTAQLHAQRLGVKCLQAQYVKPESTLVERPEYVYANLLKRNLDSMIMDHALDDYHPGVKSHRAIANYMIKYL